MARKAFHKLYFGAGAWVPSMDKQSTTDCGPLTDNSTIGSARDI
jgi:hypothetical protein